MTELVANDSKNDLYYDWREQAKRMYHCSCMDVHHTNLCPHIVSTETVKVCRFQQKKKKQNKENIRQKCNDRHKNFRKQ